VRECEQLLQSRGERLWRRDDGSIAPDGAAPLASQLMTTTYITKARRQDLIEQYMDCWFGTESYSTEDAAESEGQWMRSQLEAMNNSQLVAECKASGWGIA
jgi:hypothetical protein